MQLVSSSLHENMSANGVIEFIDPWFDPGDQEDAGLLETTRQQVKAEDALLLGRQTFEEFRGYWPQQTHDTSGIAEHLNTVKKYVFSSTMTDPEWENSTVVSRPLEDEVQALKNKPGGEIGVTGSISVVHALMQANLLDEYRLFVYPVLASRGRNLVPEGLSLDHLSLVDTHAYQSGVVLLTYARS